MSSNNDLMLDVSQAAELKLAFRRHGWNNAEIKALSEGDILANVLKVIKGQAEIKIIEHVIDCDADPYIPNNWWVKEHKKSGLFKFDLTKITLYQPDRQSKKEINGNDLRKMLQNKAVMNANVLDFLLANPTLIPEQWKEKYSSLIFWGTIYHEVHGLLAVRYLNWTGSKWRWNFVWLDGAFGVNQFAVLAK